ncbi:hypothetical protein EV356DRAFT_519242 [Viridothelium virens]|uniref:Uncharacterized protein n=1 Tax=Viridothelium virens TaxID=1048519 RepID=A0A6A6GZD1_VIRVR|nr:hypothetical protein EV356DRAFT_519242 [Viridothelium virens]
MVSAASTKSHVHTSGTNSAENPASNFSRKIPENRTLNFDTLSDLHIDNRTLCHSAHTLAISANATNSLHKRTLRRLNNWRDQRNHIRTIWRNIDQRHVWIDLNMPNGQIRNQGLRFPNYPGESVFGIETLAGNTAVLIITKKGVFISLIAAESPFYHDESGHLQQRTEQEFLIRTYGATVLGTLICPSAGLGIAQLGGRGELFSEETPALPHPVHIYIITPQAPTGLLLGLDNGHHREHQIVSLRDRLRNLFPNVPQGGVNIFGYSSDARYTQRSRVTIEIDTHEGYLEEHPASIRPEYGTWRLWVGHVPKQQGYFIQDA